MKLKELTQEQQQKLVEFRAEIFRQATSTEPADRARAEAAARRMAEIGGVAVNRIVWVSTPEQGLSAYDEAWDSLRDSIRASFSASLRDSLSDSLRASFSASLWVSLRASISASLRDSIRASFSASLRDSLSDSLRASFSASLWVSLRASISASIRASLRASLRDSLYDSLRDSPWQAFYTFPALHMGVEYAPDVLEKLNLHREIAASCFAMWLVPGTVILCDRPEAVEIVDGKLISLTWRNLRGASFG